MNLDAIILFLFVVTGISFGIYHEHHHKRTYYSCTVIESQKELPLVSSYDLKQLEILYANQLNKSLVCEPRTLTSHQKKIYNSTLTIEAN